jgi:hypothetical protein
VDVWTNSGRSVGSEKGRLKVHIALGISAIVFPWLNDNAFEVEKYPI